MNAVAADAGWTDVDRRAMSRALQLASRGLRTTDPNPRVGCVLMLGGEVVGEGWHERAGGPHAEAAALAAAGARARGATAYVTLEPCDHHGRTPPCSLALIEAGVARVVYALRDPDPRVRGNGEERLRRAGIEVGTGLMAEAAAELNAGYVSRMLGGRPFVRVKLAASLDARTALAGGESRWITSEEARADVHAFRARSSAVLTGIGTVLADDPRLDARLPGVERQPWRVVLDSSLRIPPEAALLSQDVRVLVMCATADAAKRRALEDRGASVDELPATDGRLDLHAVLDRLAQMQMNEIWVEAGARLAGAFVEAGLCDELVVYVAPTLLGSQAQGLLEIASPADMGGRRRLRFTDFRMIGPDLRVIARPEGAG